MSARWSWLVPLLLLACATPGRNGAAGGEQAYLVTVGPGGERLDVEAVFPPGAELRLAALPATTGFCDGVASVENGVAEPLDLRRDGYVLPASGVERRVRWTFRARDAGRAIDDGDVAAWYGRGFAGSLSAFLLRDADPARDARLRLRVNTEAGTAFACSLPPGEPHEFVGGAGVLAQLPACAFGDVRVRYLARDDHVLVLADLVERGEDDADAIVAWARAVEDGVARFFGRFPVERLLLVLTPGGGAGVGPGRARGYGGASIAIRVGAAVGARELDGDWVLWHEMIHLAMPALARPHNWLSEGAATFVEPLLRARAGLATEEEVWSAMLAEYDQGLPGPRDRGLDREGGWGRTYYGGAIFCLEADVEIRARTGNRRSLRDALAAVLAAGGDGTVDWPIERLLAVGDAATGVTVLRELYEARRASPGPRTLAPLWARLGVRAAGNGLEFDDGAPLADVRRALVLGG